MHEIISKRIALLKKALVLAVLLLGFSFFFHGEWLAVVMLIQTAKDHEHVLATSNSLEGARFFIEIVIGMALIALVPPKEVCHS